MRAVHDLRASDGENAPWRQDARAVHSPTALCGAFRIHATHILPKLAVFEYMAAIYCHELAFFLSEAPSGTHRGDILPWPAARERIGAQSRHPGAGGVRRGACCPQGRSWGAGLSGGGGTVLRGSWRSFGTERAASAGRSCGAAGRSGGRPNCGAPGRCGAAVSAGGWASPREGHGHLRMTNYPRQRKGSQLTPPSPPQDKGRRAHCSPSFAVLFTARVAPGPSR